MIEISADSKTENARIMVIGVGGGGNNAVNSMVADGVLGVTYACLNTDKQALERCRADYCVQIGQQLTKGLGAGAKPEIGEAAAMENEDDIRELVRGQDMVIITCGMGGGTGTGAAPVVAKITKELGILTVGVVTRPFQFEAKIRMQNAINGIEKLKQYTDTLIVISNNKLLEIVDRKTTMPEALKKSDMILKQTIQGITDLINRPAMINLDFADVTTIMKDKGTAYIGIGTGHGENRTIEAVENALNSPLLETSILGATHVLLNISGDVTLWDTDEGAGRVQELVSDEANIIFGAMYDDSEPDTVTVTIIATGVEKNEKGGAAERQNVRPKRVTPSRTNVQEPVQEQTNYYNEQPSQNNSSNQQGYYDNTQSNNYVGGDNNFVNNSQNYGGYPQGNDSMQNGGYTTQGGMTGNTMQSGNYGNSFDYNMTGNDTQNNGGYGSFGTNPQGNTYTPLGNGNQQNGYAATDGFVYQNGYMGGENEGTYSPQLNPTQNNNYNEPLQSISPSYTRSNSKQESSIPKYTIPSKVTEFQTRRETDNSEIKFSTIQSKSGRPKQTEMENSYDDEEEEESNSGFNFIDFLKGNKRKR